MIYLKYRNIYQDMHIPNKLTTLTSKKKPILILKGPKLIQLFGFWPNPNDLDKIKKSLTTPSGIIILMNKDNAVPRIQPTRIIKKIKNIDLLFISNI